MFLNMLHINSVFDTIFFIHHFQPTRKIWQILYSHKIAFEMYIINGILTNETCEQANISFRHVFTKQKWSFFRNALQFHERIKYQFSIKFISFLGKCKASLV